jgi:hypothetical protein
MPQHDDPSSWAWRPGVFIAISYHKNAESSSEPPSSYRPEDYDYVIRNAIEAAEAKPLRADEIPGQPARHLQGHVLQTIARAKAMVAAIPPNDHPSRANVLYEAGVAHGRKIPVIFVVQDVQDLPSDLAGVVPVVYTTLREMEKQILDRLLVALKDSRTMRQFLSIQTRHPSYIVASPYLPAGERGSGDNLGIVNIIAAFGSERKELLQYVAPTDERLLERTRDNLYLIGSPGAFAHPGPVRVGYAGNALTACALKALVGDEWVFVPREGTRDNVFLRRESRDYDTGPEAPSADYGLIVRGYERGGGLRMVLAGAHSLGTGAACKAATDERWVQRIVQLIKNQLGFDPIAVDARETFWVLVKGTGRSENPDVEVIQVGRPSLPRHKEAGAS